MRMGLEGQGLWAQTEGASMAAPAAALDCRKLRRDVEGMNVSWFFSEEGAARQRGSEGQ